ncbi:MAG: T9SS type A sorting domain-containing protein [Bacteroidia bacterium]|nr:T9SS type A sorting domain-containing protein [Bacteroidia bacterium]
MKAYFIILAIILTSLTFRSQTYKPFPNDSATWGFHKSNPSGPTYVREIVKGDTVLGEKNYHKAYSNVNTNSLVGFYREFGKKIYAKVYLYPDTSEILIYDFNLNAGDTFYDKRYDPNLSQSFYYKYVLNNITTTTLTTDVRKQYNFNFVGYQGTSSSYSNLGGACNFFWIEGIGSLKGIFNNRAQGEGTLCHVAALVSNASFVTLQCFEHKSIQYMSNSCITLNQKEITDELVFKLYPNPANEFLNFEPYTDYADNKVLIYNSIGQLVKEEIINKNYVDVKDLPAGVYLLHLLNSERNNKSSHTRFIIAR